MRRWNGWGEEGQTRPVSAAAWAFLEARLGPGRACADVELEALCGRLPASQLADEPGVVCDPQTRIRHAAGQSLADWLRLRFGRIGTVPDGVVFPEHAAAIRHWLNRAQEAGWQVVPYGGGTSVVGHFELPAGGQPVLVLSLARCSGLLAFNRMARLACFGAGTSGPELEAALAREGMTLGHFPQSFEYSTVGGWVVTRSSGQESLGYGRIEQLFAGGRLETPRGTLEVPTFPASAAGPDLREWVLGSEGRFGVLSEVWVRVQPQPACSRFIGVFFPHQDEALQALRTLAQEGQGLSMLRLSNATETQVSLTLAGHGTGVAWLRRYLRWRGVGEGGCLLLIGARGPTATVRRALRAAWRVCRARRGVYAGARLGQAWAAGRFANVYLRNTLWERGYAIDTMETALNWPALPEAMAAIEAAGRTALMAHGRTALAYTHVSHVYGQGASLYTTFVYPLAGEYEQEHATWQALKQAVSQAIVRVGGTISHQHGVGRDHRPYLAAEKGVLGMGALATLGRYFDPEGRLNPGVLFDEAAP